MDISRGTSAGCQDHFPGDSNLITQILGITRLAMRMQCKPTGLLLSVYYCETHDLLPLAHRCRRTLVCLLVLGIALQVDVGKIYFQNRFHPGTACVLETSFTLYNSRPQLQRADAFDSHISGTGRQSEQASPLEWHALQSIHACLHCTPTAYLCWYATCLYSVP